MKQKFYLSVLVLFLFSQAQAQVSKGTFRIGPSVSYSRINQDLGSAFGSGDLTLTNFASSFALGGFLADNLGLNLVLEYSLQSTKFNAENITRTTGFFVGPNLQYMVPLNERLYLPIEGVAGFNVETTRRTDTSGEFQEGSPIDGLAWGVSVGLEYLVAKSLGARLSLLYSQTNLKGTSDTEFKSDGFQVGIGINFYFMKNAE